MKKAPVVVESTVYILLLTGFWSTNTISFYVRIKFGSLFISVLSDLSAALLLLSMPSASEAIS